MAREGNSKDEDIRPETQMAMKVLALWRPGEEVEETARAKTQWQE